MNDIQQVLKDLADLNLPKDLDAGLKKLGVVSLNHGSRIWWYYKEDKEFYEGEGFDPKKSECFSGILIAIPGTILRSPNQELEIDNCIIIMDTYPTGKEYCEAIWIALNRFLDDKQLIAVFIK